MREAFLAPKGVALMDDFFFPLTLVLVKFCSHMKKIIPSCKIKKKKKVLVLPMLFRFHVISCLKDIRLPGIYTHAFKPIRFPLSFHLNLPSRAGTPGA